MNGPVYRWGNHAQKEVYDGGKIATSEFRYYWELYPPLPASDMVIPDLSSLYGIPCSMVITYLIEFEFTVK